MSSSEELSYRAAHFGMLSGTLQPKPSGAAGLRTKRTYQVETPKVSASETRSDETLKEILMKNPAIEAWHIKVQRELCRRILTNIRASGRGDVVPNSAVDGWTDEEVEYFVDTYRRWINGHQSH